MPVVWMGLSSADRRSHQPLLQQSLSVFSQWRRTMTCIWREGVRLLLPLGLTLAPALLSSEPFLAPFL